MRSSTLRWVYSKDKKALRAEFSAKDFMAAVRLIGRIAKIAEKMDHHPDIHLTRYRRLRLVLTTHSKGRVTSKDLKLAKAIDKLIIKLNETKRRKV